MGQTIHLFKNKKKYVLKLLSSTIFYNRRNSKFGMNIFQVFKDKIFQESAEEEFLSVDIVDCSATLFGHVVVVEHILK